MDRRGRLAHARATNWLARNKSAKNLVRRYRRCFGVDIVAAALELRSLGAEVSEERMNQLKASAESQSKSARRKRRAAKEEEQDALQRELDRRWPVWADEPYPFAVDGWEIAADSLSKAIREDATAAAPKPGRKARQPSVDDDLDIPF